MNRSHRSVRAGAADPVHLRERSFQLFELLVESARNPVSKSQIIERVWDGRAISDDSITQAVSEIRRALAPHGHQVIKTISGTGYRLAVPVRDEEDTRPAPTHRAVAVEPFVCLSDDREMALLARGMSSDLGHYLAQAKVFRVLLAATDVPPPKGCSHTVRGTLRHHRDQIRITVSVIDNFSQELIWTDQWDCQTADFFQIQEVAVQAIANHLASPWSGQIAAHASVEQLDRETDDLDAYACFQRGVAATETQSVAGMLTALEALKTAVALDPGYGQAWACLSVVYGVLTTDARGDKLSELTRLRIAAARRAFDCNPKSALAYLAGAKLAAFDGDTTAAKDRLRAATEKAPWDSDILAMAAGIAALNTDLLDDAVAWGRQALDLSLKKPNWYHFPIGYAHFFRGDFVQAHAALVQGPQTYPELLAYKAASEAALGAAERAKKTLRALLDLSPDFSTVEYLKSEPWGVPDKVALITERFAAANIPD